MILNETSPLIVDASSTPKGDSPAPLPAEESLIQRMGLGRKRATLLIFTAIALMGVATRYVVPSPAFSWSKTKLQGVANVWSKKYLIEPSLFSERFYNSTKRQQERMRWDALTGRLDPKPELPPPAGCQTTVLLIRHCEKGTVREHCSHQGFERAQYISTLFGPGARWPTPSLIFGMNPGERNRHTVRNYREEETMEPLSKKTGVKVDTNYGTLTKDNLAKHVFGILRSGDMCGKMIVICWKHQEMGYIAHHLGCGPANNCPKKWPSGLDFDDIWQINYSYRKSDYPGFAPGEKINWLKPWGEHPQWWIAGNVQKEGFDPLSYAYKKGTSNSNNGH